MRQSPFLLEPVTKSPFVQSSESSKRSKLMCERRRRTLLSSSGCGAFSAARHRRRLVFCPANHQPTDARQSCPTMANFPLLAEMVRYPHDTGRKLIKVIATGSLGLVLHCCRADRGRLRGIRSSKEVILVPPCIPELGKSVKEKHQGPAGGQPWQQES